MLQPVEEMIFDSNSTEKYKNIFRNETEIKWIKLLQTPFPLGFNENIYHQGNTSKMPDFNVFSLLDIRGRYRRSRDKTPASVSAVFKELAQHPPHTLFDMWNLFFDHP